MDNYILIHVLVKREKGPTTIILRAEIDPFASELTLCS